MSIEAYESILGLRKYSDDDTNHGAGLKANYDAIGAALGPQNIFWVSPSFTTAALANSGAGDRRHFDTIQGAIDAAAPLGGSYSSMPTIFLYPSDYQEDLTITKSITISAVGPCIAGAQGAGASPRISGSNQPEPVITIAPADSVSIAVNFAGVYLHNGYNAANAVQINKAYLLKVSAQGIIGTNPIYIGFDNCTIRMQTWGEHNSWRYGMDIDGWNAVIMNNCEVAGVGYGGGHYDGGIQELIQMNGIHPIDKSSTLRIKRTSFRQQYLVANNSDARIFALDNRVNGTVGRCEFSVESGVILEAGVNGSNYLSGLASGSFSDYGNIDGVNLFFS